MLRANQSIIYAVTDIGGLLYYRDEARNGTARWSYGGTGQKIGNGWGDFLHVLSGNDGIIYTIAPNGDLFYYRDEARNGTARWSYGGAGQKIGNGWNSFTKVCPAVTASSMPSPQMATSSITGMKHVTAWRVGHLVGQAKE